MRIVRVVDLSHPIDQNTQVYPGDPVPHLEQHSNIARDGFNLMSVEIGSQSGTHVDAPWHFDDDRLKIDELPLSHFVGEALVLDCSLVKAREEITLASVENQIPNGALPHIVLFRTEWSRFYQTDEYFNNPFLSPELVEHLLSRGVITFGLDAINIDETPDDDHPGNGFKVHHLIADAGGVICENMTNLAEIDFAKPFVSILPIKFVGIDGAPVRAVAMQVA